MGRESTSSRAEQLAQHLLIFGRPLPLAEIIGEVEAVDRRHLGDVAERLTGTPSACAVMGPLDGLAHLSELTKALG